MPEHLTHLSPDDLARIREARCPRCKGDGFDPGSTGTVEPDECAKCDGTGRPEVVWLAPMEPQPKPKADRINLRGSMVEARVGFSVEVQHAPHRSGDVLVVAEEWWHVRDGRGSHHATRILATEDPVAVEAYLCSSCSLLTDDTDAVALHGYTHWGCGGRFGQRYAWICRGRVKDA